VLGDAVAHHGVELVDMDKDAFFGGYDGPPPGLFFCDADHSYEATRKDLLWARSQGARIICGHDFHPTLHQGVTRAVSELGGPSKLVGCLFVL
jgi:hypothetical protein